MDARDAVETRGGLPEHEAIRLVMAATGRTRTDVILGFVLTHGEADRYRSFVARRLKDEPLQYIEGTVDFGAVELEVDDRVLVPRPETEYMLEQAIALVRSPRVIVDLCTGSGNLALALASEFPKASVYAVDLSPEAAAVAETNASRNGLDVDVLVGDLFDPLPGSLMGHIDLLVANPPYLAEREVADLPRDVLKEPRMALVSGVRGDEVVARIAHGATTWLAPGGVVVCEISEFSPQRSGTHFEHLDGEVHRDLTGRERFVTGHRRVG